MIALISAVIIVLVLFDSADRRNWPQPYLNYADAYDSPQEAINAYRDGNIVYFPPGEYDGGLIIQSKKNIILYGQEGSLLKFNDVGLTIIDSENVHIEGMKCIGRWV